MMKTVKKKVVFSPDTTNIKIQTFTATKRSVPMMGSASSRNKHNLNYKSSSASSSSSSAMRFLKRVGAKVAKALGFGSSGKKWSRKVSASSSVSGPVLVRSWSYAESARLDSSLRAEAIEDCIEYLNSSSASSLQRSISTTSSSSPAR